MAVYDKLLLIMDNVELLSPFPCDPFTVRRRPNARARVCVCVYVGEPTG
jgi:hypothetical protein